MDYNKDYYLELGVNKDASDEDIKKAFRKLAHKHHPDKNHGNKESELKFQKLNEANSILSDSKTRQEYDTRSPHGNSYSPFNQFGGGGGQGFEFHFGGPGDDFFSQFFGGGGGGGFNPFDPFRRATEEFRENLDINVNATINLKQIYNNENLNIKYQKNIHCDKCNGTGFDNTSHSDICEVCDGKGKDAYGRNCTYCNGGGKIYTGQCPNCKGEKVILKDTEITLQNLAQLRTNVRNAQPGFGHQSKYYREKVGNLVLNILINRDDKYEIINHYELHKNIDIHFKDAIDGAEINYTHIDDSFLKIKLPTKTKNGDIIKVKGKGLLKNNSRDDLYLKINIIIDYSRI